MSEKLRRMLNTPWDELTPEEQADWNAIEAAGLGGDLTEEEVTENSETELKPCRCGGHIYVGEYKFDDGTMWRIGCMRCGLSMDTVRTKPEAIAAWNRGPLPTDGAPANSPKVRTP